MKNFYVYFYLREDLTPYYVGKGRNYRCYNFHRDTLPVPKDRKYIFKVKENLTEFEAFTWEIYYIKLYGRKDLGTGILKNLTDGGEGITGVMFDRSICRKMHWKIKTPNGDIEYIENLKKYGESVGVNYKGLSACAHHKTRHYHNYQVRKINDKTPFFDGFEHNTAKSIVATNIQTGDKLYFDSIGQCKDKLSIDHSSVSLAVNGKMDSAGGYIFEYQDQELKNKAYQVSIKRKNSYKQRDYKKLATKLSKSFIATDPNGNEYIDTNLREFCRIHNITSNVMSLVANGKRNHHKGWTCKYIEDIDDQDNN